MKKHTLNFTRNDLVQALHREGVKQWSSKAFNEALKMKGLTAAVNHVLDNS